MAFKLIELAGVDGSGKTSLAERLAFLAEGIHYPCPPKPIKQIREELRTFGPEAMFHYYLMGNYISAQEIPPFLETRPLFADPYISATRAFGLANFGDDQGYSPGLLLPDKIIYLTASWEEIERRLQERGEKRKAHENLPYLREYAAACDLIFSGRKDVLRVDTTNRRVEDVADELFLRLEL